MHRPSGTGLPAVACVVVIDDGVGGGHDYIVSHRVLSL
jgi:hypothetical protein